MKSETLLGRQPISYGTIFPASATKRVIARILPSLRHFDIHHQITHLLHLAVLAPYEGLDVAHIREAMPKGGSHIQSGMLAILHLQLEYMTLASRRDKEVQDFKLIANEFNSCMASFPDHHQVPAIARVVAHNYCGLAFKKAAELIGASHDLYVDYARNAYAAFKTAAHILERHEDCEFPLWSGYVFFNRARIGHILGEKTALDHLHRAELCRRNVASSPLSFSDAVGKGLVKEVEIIEGYKRTLLSPKMPPLAGAQPG